MAPTFTTPIAVDACTLPDRMEKALGATSKALADLGCDVTPSALMTALRPFVEQKFSQQFQLPVVTNATSKEVASALKKAERLVAGAKSLRLDLAKRCSDELDEYRQEMASAAKRRALGLTEEQVVPKDFICPITHEKMKDPVVVSDGNSYERSAIQHVLSTTGTSPMTRERLDPRIIAPNRTLKNRIEAHEKEVFALVEGQKRTGGSKSGNARAPKGQKRDRASSSLDLGSSLRAAQSIKRKKPTGGTKKKATDDEKDKDWAEGDD